MNVYVFVYMCAYIICFSIVYCGTVLPQYRSCFCFFALTPDIPAEFLSFYGLLNFYLYTLAFVYSPSKNALYGN